MPTGPNAFVARILADEGNKIAPRTVNSPDPTAPPTGFPPDFQRVSNTFRNIAVEFIPQIP